MAMGHDHCRWVTARLPLLAGGDLLGLDRRRVERHLLNCPGCCQRFQVLQTTLEHLHTVGNTPSPDSAAGSSLWPALARQIRETRREAGHSPLVPYRSWAWRAGLAASFLALMVSASVGLYHFHRKTQVIVRPWPPVIALRPRTVVRPVSLRREIPPPVSEPATSVVDTGPPAGPETSAPIGTAN